MTDTWFISVGKGIDMSMGWMSYAEEYSEFCLRKPTSLQQADFIRVEAAPFKSRKENPQKLTQLSSRSHPRHLVGKRTAQKDITIDTTSDSQANSNFPNKWSPASLTFNNYFYLFLYLYITWITTNNNAPHLKSPKNQKQKSRLGTASNKNHWGAWTSLWSTNPRP